MAVDSNSIKPELYERIYEPYGSVEALTLTDRLARLKPLSDKRPGEIDAKRAARVFERWRVQVPFDQEGFSPGEWRWTASRGGVEISAWRTGRIPARSMPERSGMAPTI